MGYAPYWYRLLTAARYYECKPWELIDLPIFWTEIAIAAMSAEAGAQESMTKRVTPTDGG